MGDGRLAFTGGPPKVLWHTTEGRTLEDAIRAYINGGNINPHITATWTGTKTRIAQHVSTASASFALRNLAGGVQTNTDHAIQIEVVATCDLRKRGQPGWLYIEDLPDQFVADLGKLVRWLGSDAGVPPVSSVTWMPYPHAGDAQRLSGPAWDVYGGHLGHQHVPENDHGDPGLLPLERIFKAAGVADTPSTPEARIMAVAIEPVSSVTRWVDGKPAGGYVFGRRGHVYAFDGAPFVGGWPGAQPGETIDRDDCIALVPTRTGGGYWLVGGSDGDVYSYGDAVWPGNYRQDEWGHSAIVGAFLNDQGNQPCGGVTMVRALDLATYHLAPGLTS